MPDGSITKDDDAVSAWLGRRVVLRDTSFDATRTYEVPLEVEPDREDAWVTWNGPRGAFHDSTRARVSLVSRGTLGANVVLDGSGEDELVGSHVTIGHAVLDVIKPIDRCVMVTRPQPGGIDRDVDVLKTINRDRAGNLAIGALVVQPGAVAIGDEVVPTRR